MTFNYEEIASLDYFDSRDVVERVSEIRKRDDLEEYEELQALLTILGELNEAFPPSKWMDVRTDIACGVSGFADHYAEEYAETYAHDTGAVVRDSWVSQYVDWEKAADDLKEDYTEVEILGHTFYLRD